jgi:primosomal protein N'
MNAYQSPAAHAREVARVKASLARTPVEAVSARPDCDARARVSGQRTPDPWAWTLDPDRTTRHHVNSVPPGGYRS